MTGMEAVALAVAVGCGASLTAAGAVEVFGHGAEGRRRREEYERDLADAWRRHNDPNYRKPVIFPRPSPW